ncbi:hypothetical protein COUCH_11415 [Couchioplanes caeruleus]|uniref:hypothetical protein n=1 Tax=Couchioplanes caeruleus TaxID=56438 RepID=UPI0020C029EF|nr:hypothetical protein [Couchioplanes caeruleus]UQU66832.1 hypothetical protein COUCH_11415 [Couchioplanes caeruleus]
MLIGYSFWGFLGNGITDTPDGGRSHRRTLIDGLLERGHRIVFLQANRDHDEAGLDLSDTYQWNLGLPDIDALFLEWRWPIPDRNTTACKTPGHTCDLHRQQQLLDHYTAAGVPTLLWDKDRQLPANDCMRHTRNVAVCEPALHPTPGAATLLFPVSDKALDGADPGALTAGTRDLPLVYIGNQYDRDGAFDRYFAPAATGHPHLVAGKWTRTQRWPELNFYGRMSFAAVDPLYRRAVCTMLLLPDRYAQAGQMTQRLFEAVLAGCLPLTPADIRDATKFAPTALHVRDAAGAARTIAHLQTIVGTAQHADLLADCLHKLDLFRLSRQLEIVDRQLSGLVRGGVG